MPDPAASKDGRSPSAVSACNSPKPMINALTVIGATRSSRKAAVPGSRTRASPCAARNPKTSATADVATASRTEFTMASTSARSPSTLPYQSSVSPRRGGTGNRPACSRKHHQHHHRQGDEAIGQRQIQPAKGAQQPHTRSSRIQRAAAR